MNIRYTILIKKQAKKKLLSLPLEIRQRISEKIAWLGDDPKDLRLDIKKLEGKQTNQHWRLRVGDWRVIFEKDDEIKIISIDTIKPRGDAYK